jgi:hypothetical protein
MILNLINSCSAKFQTITTEEDRHSAFLFFIRTRAKEVVDP